MKRVVALFSGGLDSSLAIRILQQQQFEVEALNVRTTFECCDQQAAEAAQSLGVRLRTLSVKPDYADVLKHPRYGYGKGANPCIDCRIYMARMARELMVDLGACAVITGEILGQRPMSQKRRDLDAVARHSGLEGRLLRPLSAKKLAPTIPEREGLVDRERLYEFTGRARGPLVELARQLGVEETPTPSTGCALTEKSFAPRVFDILEFDRGATTWDFELLNLGRHIRRDRQSKVVVGRDARENAALAAMFSRAEASAGAYLHPHNFLGADAILVGEPDADAVNFAAALVVRYSSQSDFPSALIEVTTAEGAERLRPVPDPAAAEAVPL
jgi:hypothetical protein